MNINRDINRRMHIITMHLGVGVENTDRSPILNNLILHNRIPGFEDGQQLDAVALARLLRLLAHALDPFEGDLPAADAVAPLQERSEPVGPPRRRLRFSLDE